MNENDNSHVIWNLTFLKITIFYFMESAKGEKKRIVPSIF